MSNQKLYGYYNWQGYSIIGFSEKNINVGLCSWIVGIKIMISH